MTKYLLLLLLFSLPAFAQDRLCIDVAQWEAAHDDLPIAGDWRAQADQLIMSLEGGSDDSSQWRMIVDTLNEQGRAIRAIQADVARLKTVRPTQHHYHPVYQSQPTPLPPYFRHVGDPQTKPKEAHEYHDGAGFNRR